MEERAVKQICEKLLLDVSCDFVGFAIQNSDGPDVTWRIAAGNSNNKYKRITVRYGKGIAGKVIATGQSIEIENFPDNISGKALDYPIMLAEKLLYAFAVPIQIKGIPKGVLLVGRRTINPTSVSEQQLVKLAAAKIEAL